MFRSKTSRPVFSQSGTGRPPSYRQWSTDTLKRACQAVHDGKSVRQAAEEYNIPRSTLHDYISGKVVLGSKSGPKSYLTSSEEEELMTFLVGMSSVGYSHTVQQVIDIVQNVVNKKGMEVKVTASWWKSFKSRHKDITLRNPETLTHSRIAGSSNSQIEHYLETTVSESDLSE